MLDTELNLSINKILINFDLFIKRRTVFTINKLKAIHILFPSVELITSLSPPLLPSHIHHMTGYPLV